MHYFLTTVGSAGDVFPMMGLALALQKRGHDVTLVTSGYFRPLAEKHGIPFEQLGTPEDYQNCIQNPDLWNPQKAFQHIFRFLQPTLRRQHELLVTAAQARPTVAISSCLGLGARMAQETHQVPVLTVHLQPAVIWSRFNPPHFPGMFGPNWFKDFGYRLAEKWLINRPVLPFLNSWRQEFQLPPVKRVTDWWNSPTGVFCLFPDWFAAPQPDWPAPLFQTDFPLWNDDSQSPLDTEVERFLSAGDPPIVFTPGTANIHGRKFFEVALQACRQLQRRGIFLTKYPEQIPVSLPETVRHLSYVPLDRLLYRSAAFVHHGGVGSTSQGFLGGIPQVVMPLAHDQFDNGDRVRRLNAGRSVPESRFTPGNLTKALRELLGSSDVTAICQDIRKRLQRGTGIESTADLISRQFSGDSVPHAR